LYETAEAFFLPSTASEYFERSEVTQRQLLHCLLRRWRQLTGHLSLEPVTYDPGTGTIPRSNEDLLSDCVTGTLRGEALRLEQKMWQNESFAPTLPEDRTAGLRSEHPDIAVAAPAEGTSSLSQRLEEVHSLDADEEELVTPSARAQGHEAATAALNGQPKLHRKRPRPLHPGSREDRLQKFIVKEKCSISDVCRSAKVSEREMRRWRDGEMKEDGHPASRIESVLGGYAPLQRNNRARHWLRTPGRTTHTV
jgi:hypothetical protein